jgi:hypothetical protein
MKKKMTRSEIIDDLLKTSESFRRLHDKVVALNGGRLPSSDEIGRRLQARIAQGRRANS